jgi:hypothetical protein
MHPRNRSGPLARCNFDITLFPCDSIASGAVFLWSHYAFNFSMVTVRLCNTRPFSGYIQVIFNFVFCLPSFSLERSNRTFVVLFYYFSLMDRKVVLIHSYLEYKKISCTKKVVHISCFWRFLILSRIWGSHGGEYEDGCLLGCSAV